MEELQSFRSVQQIEQCGRNSGDGNSEGSRSTVAVEATDLLNIFSHID